MDVWIKKSNDNHIISLKAASKNLLNSHDKISFQSVKICLCMVIRTIWVKLSSIKDGDNETHHRKFSKQII